MVSMTTEVMDIQGLARYLKLAPVTLYKMVKEGKVPCRRIGKSLRFPKGLIDQWLNQPQIIPQAIPEKISGVVLQFARRIRKALGERVREMRLYGSWARGEARIDSDIDLVVIVDRKDLNVVRAVSDMASEVSLESDQFLSAVVIEDRAHRQGLSQGSPFHRKIDREGISI